jgi:hypothetical protein
MTRLHNVNMLGCRHKWYAMARKLTSRMGSNTKWNIGTSLAWFAYVCGVLAIDHAPFS